MINIPKVYVVHVKKGYENRKKSIDLQMEKHDIAVEYMLDGDIEDLTKEHLEKYYSGAMKAFSPEASCTIKHLLIYEKMILNNITEALIFEDDIFLNENFVEIFNTTIVELHQRKDIKINKTIVSYENSTLKIIPKNELKKGQYLYLNPAGRCAGAYYISLGCAKMIIEKCRTEKMDVPIDWYHNQLSEAGLLDIYWCVPAIAEQGSQNGMFDSSLDLRKKNTWLRRLKWKIRKFFKGV